MLVWFPHAMIYPFEFDDCHVEYISCDAMLHRISCDNSLGHIMFANPLDLSYDMHEINHMSYLEILTFFL